MTHDQQILLKEKTKALIEYYAQTTKILLEQVELLIQEIDYLKEENERLRNKGDDQDGLAANREYRKGPGKGQ